MLLHSAQSLSTTTTLSDLNHQLNRVNKIAPKGADCLAEDHIMILRLSEGGNSVATDSEKLVNQGMVTKQDLHHD